MREVVLAAQGIYYVVTGAWPLLHFASFERVTGPKQDVWLVKTVGALVVAIGAALLSAGARRRREAEFDTLAVGAAAGLAAIGTVYVWKRTISPVYLLDVALEVLLAGALAISHRSRREAGTHQQRQWARLAAAENARRTPERSPTVPTL